MTSSCFIIAVDGPAGAGKSTTSRELARRLGLVYIDSGAMYRAVGLKALVAGVDLADEAAVAALIPGMDFRGGSDGVSFLLDGRDVTLELRTPRVSDAASRTSALPAVRQALVDWQRGAARPPGIVIEGRDIGTVIFPDADLKVFLDAEPVERARRRAAERGESQTEAVAAVARELAERDDRDRSRAVAPLAAAPDAVRVDSSSLSFEAVVERLVREARARMAAK